jgi:hypothetical protein
MADMTGLLPVRPGREWPKFDEPPPSTAASRKFYLQLLSKYARA